MGGYKSLGSLKSLISYAPRLSGASTLAFSILNPLRVHHLGVIAVTEGLEASSPIVSNVSSLRVHPPQGCNVMA